MEMLHQLEGAVLLFLQEHVRTGVLSSLLVPLTYACEHGEIWILLSIVLLFFHRTRKAGVLALVSMLLCWGSSELVLKAVVRRTRPFRVIEGLVPAVAPPQSFSFPSGHSCASLSAAGSHWRVLELGWLRWAVLVIALLIAFSRLYLGVHYPTDVLAGSLWGWFGSGAVVHFASPVYDRVANRMKKRK